eukprot:2547401-Amphidinium_carterae.1
MGTFHVHVICLSCLSNTATPCHTKANVLLSMQSTSLDSQNLKRPESSETAAADGSLAKVRSHVRGDWL